MRSLRDVFNHHNKDDLSDVTWVDKRKCSRDRFFFIVRKHILSFATLRTITFKFYSKYLLIKKLLDFDVLVLVSLCLLFKCNYH